MIARENCKQYQVQMPQGHWVDAEFGLLEVGDICRELSPDDKLVTQASGCINMRITQQPYFTFEDPNKVPDPAPKTKVPLPEIAKLQQPMVVNGMFDTDLPLHTCITKLGATVTQSGTTVIAVTYIVPEEGFLSIADFVLRIADAMGDTCRITWMDRYGKEIGQQLIYNLVYDGYHFVDDGYHFVDDASGHPEILEVCVNFIGQE